MNTQIAAYVCARIIFHHKKEWRSDAHYNEYEFQRYHAKWKYPDTDHILYDSIIMQYPESVDL